MSRILPGDLAPSAAHPDDRIAGTVAQKPGMVIVDIYLLLAVLKIHDKPGPGLLGQGRGGYRGRAGLAGQRVVPVGFHRGAVDGGDLQALPQGRDPQVRVAPS
jgi:hypothetical protein